MSSDQVWKNKKGWKAIQADYDYIFSLRERECCYSLSDQEVAALLAMTEYLKWTTRWVKSEGEIDLDIITTFADKLERNLMAGCCDDNIPIQYRYTSGGVLQRSLNGGGSWTDAPEYDPRVYSPQFPPLTGDDSDGKKCVAATGAAALIKEQVGDQLTDDMSRYTLSQLIGDWVHTMIDTSNPLQALATVITNQIFALIIATLRPALTDDVYEKLKCAFYANIASDATFNDAQWAQVRSDITSKIGGIAGIFLEHLVYLLGTGGLTNLARAGGASSGDCSGCGGGCPDLLDWHVVASGDGSTGIIDETISAKRLHAARLNVGGDGFYYIQLESDDDAIGCSFTSIVITGNPFSQVFAWNLTGETRGTFTHSGAHTDIYGVNVNSVMLRTIDPNTLTLHVDI